MKIVCAPDSFKESMTSVEAAQAMARGIHRVDPTIECVLVPMADGGEGTTEALLATLDGEWVEASCHDALGRPSTGRFGFVPARRLAIIEVAEAAGLAQVPLSDRDPWAATSRGVGDLIRSALDRGATELIVGLGGSATNDAGAGMLAALGVRFLDHEGRPVAAGARGLMSLASVDLGSLDARLCSTTFRIASDVSNPLLGDQGASAVYGPQKGATPLDVPGLDAALTRWADVVEPAFSRRVRDLPGAGAAGGLGAALAVATDATMESGVELVRDAVGLRDRIAGADWVFTGEGGIDRQTASGKTPWGVAQAARAEGVPAILFGGRVSDDAYELIGDAVVAVVPILRQVTDLPTALQDGLLNLECAAATVTRMLVPRAAPVAPPGR
ncbi:glycerate kinase [Sanguibacter antarcticus]|uniref:Glycerate kinase n=1 Tax=Sanguibacter antarcticus TaxID=372484 RepID=A0A2A9E267_9MICO|nr:glycerate kinase [Sanguibacter antarcticus]PFG32746.1 glycerate kinase [Sanguibacter antarcticus]